MSENFLSLTDPDAWDDTELIAAYEEALHETGQLRLGGAGGDAESGASGQRRQQRGRAKQNGRNTGQPQTQPPASLWHVGSPCRAVWSEDGQVYRARILSLAADRRSCRVVYVDFGNRERHRLQDLLPPEAGDSESGDNGEHGHSDAGVADAAAAPAAASWPPGPQAVPPPIPRLPPGAAAAMDDATYNMLMSWYMSGYYTGYYVGLRASAASDPAADYGSG